MPVHQVTVPDIGGAEGAEVIELLVAVGDQVALDQGLIVLESMKMEHTLAAPCDGVLAELTCAVGEQVAPGKLLARVEADKP